MRKLHIISLCLLLSSFSAHGEWTANEKRLPAFSRIPQEQNEKAIIGCLPKLKGFISTQETSSLDNLKTKIERIYGMMRPLIYYRELSYKNQAGDKFKVEFYLTSDSKWGKEKYRLKFFQISEKGEFVAMASLVKEETLEKDAILKFAQYEDVLSDERWERFSMPRSPEVSFKSKDFKLFEITTAFKGIGSKLLCNLAGGHPLCQCLK
jgi:hypothetical protein